MLFNILYFAFVHLTLLVPGYVIVKESKLLSKRPGIQLSLAYAASLALYALLAALDYVLKVSPLAILLTGWFILLLSSATFIYRRYYRDLYKLRFPLFCLVLMSLLSLCFIGLSSSSANKYIPDPSPLPARNYSVLSVKVLNVAQTPANDNYIPYRQAQFFVNRSDPAKDSFINEWGVSFFQRTPMMGAVVANYFILLHDKPPVDYTWSSSSNDIDHTYQKFQIIAQILNALFIVPAFFFLEKLFNKKTALISSLFLVVSQFFVYNAFFSWPKSLVAFFILASWLLLLENKLRYTLLAGIISGFAYLTHDLAVLYIGGSFLYLLWNKRFRQLFVFTGMTTLLALPWLITSSIIFDKPSSFIYFPISTKGIPQPEHSQEIIHTFLNTSPLTLLRIRIDTLLYLLTPYQAYFSEGGQSIARRAWALGLYSIPGALGIGLLIPAYLGVFKKLRTATLWILLFAPILLTILIIGWSKGVGALHFAEAIVVILTGLAVYFLNGLKNKFWLYGAYVLNVLQLGFFISYSYGFHVGNWLSHFGDIIRLLLIISVSVICGWAIYSIENGRKIWIT